MWIKRSVMFCAAGVIALVGLLVWEPWEPSHRGIRLGACVRDFDHAYDTSIFAFPENIPAQSVVALRAMSVAATPKFLQMLRTRETSLFRQGVEAFEEAAGLRFERKREISDPDLALIGFHLLGEKAASAVPELEGMLNEPALAQRAAIAIGNIREPAISALTNAVLHTNPVVRRMALEGLARMTPPRSEAFAGALLLLSNGDSGNRVFATWVLGSRTNDADRVWPVLRDLVEDNDPNVRRAVLRSLKNFGSRPLELFPKFAEQLRTSGSAAAVGVIVSGLRGMTNEPVKVVDCLLEGLRSPHEKHRILAARTIGVLEPAPDRVLPVMKPLYLNAPAGAWREELGRVLVRIEPSLAAELNIPTNQFFPRGHPRRMVMPSPFSGLNQ